MCNNTKNEEFGIKTLGNFLYVLITLEILISEEDLITIETLREVNQGDHLRKWFNTEEFNEFLNVMPELKLWFNKYK